MKKAFEVLDPRTHRTLKEHMWVKIERVEDGVLIGKLNNDPIGTTDLRCGDTVRVKLEEISQVLT